MTSPYLIKLDNARTSGGRVETQEMVGSFQLQEVDLLRGVAAIAVAFGHLRSLFFVPLAGVSSPSLLIRLFYLSSALGHESVVVFFVLSGFVISRSVLVAGGRAWSPADYLIRRWARLVVPLVPALLLTAGLDQLGQYLHQTAWYYSRPVSEFDNLLVSSTSRGTVFVGNLAFLQTVLVPPYGSNAALWSLAYEGWYYVAFCLIVVAINVRGGLAARATVLCSVILIGLVLGRGISEYFLIWLLGCGAHVFSANWLRVPSGLALFLTLSSAAVVLAKKTGSQSFGGDVMLACGIAVLLLSCKKHCLLPARMAPLSRKLASFSYSLYLIHLPIIFFLSAVRKPGNKWQPDASAIGLTAVMLLAIVFGAWCFSLMTEAKTSQVRLTITNFVRGHWKRRIPA